MRLLSWKIITLNHHKIYFGIIPLLHFQGHFLLARYQRIYVACVAGGILAPGVLSWRRSRHAKRVAKPQGSKLTCIPTLLTAPWTNQYNTPTLISSATQATL